MMHVLIVEDDDPKREKIKACIEKCFVGISISIAKSVRTGISMLEDEQPNLVLLDMSLPTFEISENESGGRPQDFGGIEILRYMDLLKIYSKAIVVTGYEAFVSEGSGMQLDELDQQLSEDHPSVYVGSVYYNSLYDEWEAKLINLIKECWDEKNENFNC